MHAFDSPYGALSLTRYPPTQNPTLQAFDAADHYLLSQLQAQPEPGPLLIINDQFGALACALAAQQPCSWGDSHLSELALAENLRINQLASGQIEMVPGDQSPPGQYQQVLLRVPKSLTLLEDQLRRLRPRLLPGAVVIAGAMIKHLPPRAGDLLARYIGPYQASLGWKKARLLSASFDPQLIPPTQPLVSHYALDGTDISLCNQPGVFSRERLDIGTRVMLPLIAEQTATATNIADLGCGNGALGIMAALHNAQAQLLFCDESYAAVASAKQNFTNALPGRTAEFRVNDGLIGITPDSLDVVLCNPPFHQQQVIGDDIALRLFQQSRSALKPGGRLLVVGNRHLGYHVKLKQYFSQVTQLAASDKFVVRLAN
ncbi:methyltransferase [uncultured Pseudomonas sp.]|uniref:methyltransferase n=1 Tax=uncultured Pseudomonas sp. TaxID=114707 RepID=UPI0030DDC55F|tara:strand:- start:5594 stop:6712 length:1119 start_codon:yes stop_codon:yes gene_type:complete